MHSKNGLRSFIRGIKIIDTHEHFEEESRRLARNLDFSVLFSPYACDDLASSGMPVTDVQRFFDSSVDVPEKWRLIAPYLDRVKHTGYFRVMWIAIRDLYGIEELSQEAAIDIGRQMQQTNLKGIYKKILHERAGIKLCHLHNLDADGVPYREEFDRSLFLQDLVVAHFIFRPIFFDVLQQQTGIAVHSFGDFLLLVNWFFDKYGAEAVAIKNNSAYWRPLRFDETPLEDARRAFEKGLLERKEPTLAEQQTYENYIFRHCIRKAIDFNLPVKIHTGYMAGIATMNDLQQANPVHLTNLFREYPEAKFVLFHAGYPYIGEIAALAKHFPNVYIDFCWAWAIDPFSMRQALKQFLCTVPVNKLLAFGGDYFSPEMAYGHSRLARNEIAFALEELATGGYISVEEGQEIAQRILCKNAEVVFDKKDSS